jgi:hypothetical protein
VPFPNAANPATIEEPVEMASAMDPVIRWKGCTPWAPYDD